MTSPLLQVTSLSLAFGGLRVLDDLSFAVDQGEIVTLIGPNGAGKSTVLNAISGLCRPNTGQIRLDGRQIVGLAPDQVARRGVARTFQSLRLFLNLTILENVMAAAYARSRTGFWQAILRTPGFRREEARVRRLAEEQLAWFGSRLQGFRHDQPAHALSYANRRRLEIARALATEPRLLLLDEPAAGMNPHETEELAELIIELRARGGYAILLVEHDMALVEHVSDRVIALDRGRAIAEGSFHAVTSSPRVVDAYLGTDHLGAGRVAAAPA